jgi:hypothetical protein
MAALRRKVRGIAGSAAARGATRALAALAGSLLLASCLEGPEDRSYFDLEADPSLTAYSRVNIRLEDSLGNPRATLFDDTLRSIAQLSRLPAGPYKGGSARIVIHGYGPDGVPRYRETRLYDGASEKVLAVDIFLGPFGTGGPAAPGDTGTVPMAPKPPVLAAFLRDTTVSIRDSVPLWAQATDADGDLAGWGLDCDGDGIFEDSSAISGYRAEIKRGRRFADSGSHACQLKIWDRGARQARARLGVRVEYDPPTADAGRDTTVEAGTAIRLHARGEDRFGPIVSREWKVGSKPFAPVPQQETVQEAPKDPQLLVCILRVTDSDGLAAEDTLLVTVIPRTSVP